jgi:hypothetical protein
MGRAKEREREKEVLERKGKLKKLKNFFTVYFIYCVKIDPFIT